MQEEIFLEDIFEVLKKHIGLIVRVIILVVALVTLVTVFVIKPKYESNSQLLVNQEEKQSEELNMGQIQTSLQMINTYSEIIISDSVLSDVQNQISVNLPIGEIRDMVEVKSSGESQLFTVSVVSEDPELSAELTNTIVEVFTKQIGKIFKVENVSILSIAQPNNTPVSPNLVLNILIAIIVGLAGSVFYIFMKESSNTTIRNEDFFKDNDIVILGSINKLTSNEWQQSLLNKTNPERSRS